jgi:hypothetical protein
VLGRWCQRRCRPRARARIWARIPIHVRVTIRHERLPLKPAPAEDLGAQAGVVRAEVNVMFVRLARCVVEPVRVARSRFGRWSVPDCVTLRA